MTRKIYSLIKQHNKLATIITRTRVVDRLTGVPTLTEQRWHGSVGFVPSSQMPRNDQVVVADAWVLTDQPLEDKSEIHCAGKAYTVLKLTNFDGYSVAALKAAAPATVYCEFRSDHEFVDTMSSSTP